jgi:hypothetical protein
VILKSFAVNEAGGTLCRVVVGVGPGPFPGCVVFRVEPIRKSARGICISVSSPSGFFGRLFVAAGLFLTLPLGPARLYSSIPSWIVFSHCFIFTSTKDRATELNRPHSEEKKVDPGAAMRRMGLNHFND